MKSSSMAIKMRILLLLVCSVAGCQAVASWRRTCDLPVYTPKSLEQSLKTFSMKSLKIIERNTKGNFVYSPFGAWMNMAMMSYGANGTTLEAIRSALALPPDSKQFRNSLKQFLQKFDDTASYYVTPMMKMYHAEDLNLRDNFKTISVELFKSTPMSVDFSDSGKVGNIINEWIARPSSVPIKNIIDPGSLDSLTRLIIVGAVYFNAKWERKFFNEDTQLRSFYPGGDVVVEVPTMCKDSYFLHGTLPDSQATFIKLPYVSDKNGLGISMYVILPKDKDSIATTLENLEHDLEYVSHPDYFGLYLQVCLPKFRLESSIDLVKPFIEMGSHIPFTKGLADFSGLTGTTEKISINKIFQKAFIGVHEEGTEDHEVTYPEDEIRSKPPTSGTFIVDRPFISVIMTENKIPLYTAIVKNPLFPN